MKVARIDGTWSYIGENGMRMSFEVCTIGKYKGRTFAIMEDGNVMEVEVKDFRDTGRVRLVMEIEVLGKALPFKEVFLNSARETRFFVDEAYSEDETYKGYTFNRYWNGWECPMFTKEVAMKIVEHYKDDDLIPMYFDEETDTFHIDEDEYKGFDIPTENGTIHVYDIGSGAWVWEEYTREIEDEEEF